MTNIKNTENTQEKGAYMPENTYEIQEIHEISKEEFIKSTKIVFLQKANPKIILKDLETFKNKNLPKIKKEEDREYCENFIRGYEKILECAYLKK